jgi:hypothetical protein
MSKIDNGGPAFPNHAEPEFPYARDGMSLRDWFAGGADVSGFEFGSLDALGAFLGEEIPGSLSHELTIALSMRAAAKLKYMAADAMLSERAKATGEAE